MKIRSSLYSWIMALIGCWLFVGCADDVLPGESVIGPEVDVVLNFGATNQEKVSISTRSTYELHYESKIQNLYVFIFAANEQKVYGRYFGSDDLNKTTEKQYWTVTNMMSNSTTQTSGTVRMRVPTISKGGEIVMIANVDLDFMNISAERLGSVTNKNELENFVVSLNQKIPERNAGYFMMTGCLSNVTIAENGQISVPNNEKMSLKRLDAKVEVNVQVIPNSENKGQKVTKFTPESWEVINLPQSSLLLSETKEVLNVSEESFFNIEPKNFETTKTAEVEGQSAIQYGFSFYTLENKRSGNKKKSVGNNLHNRELRNKNQNGQYDTSNGLWEYAPELATYVIIKGELEVEKQVQNTTEHIVADVTYYVHLGDFATDKDNYDILRNTNYKYTINIKGVNSIEVEVESSNDDDSSNITESQPGAIGNIYETEQIYNFDAHYGQCVLTLQVEDEDIEYMTWYVRTPFGREGVPNKDVNGNDVYNDLDYKWVEFMLNDMNGNTYSSGNMRYPSDKTKLLNVIDMINMVKAEKRAWKNGENHKFDSKGEMKFTVFVNEFYYDKNPMNPNDPDILWKKFVNQPPRLMHILRENLKSADGGSSVTKGNILTIRQNSIQTPFSLSKERTDLDEAWGCETLDELKNQAWFYSPDEVFMTYDIGYANKNYSFVPSGYTANNTSLTDGLYNTAQLLNLLNGNLQWDTFLDYSKEELQLKPEYKAGLYSVFLRNRDLDGDNKVDPEELRWYIASLDQLCGLYLGDQGLSGDALLYPIDIRNNGNTPISKPNDPFDGVYPWRLHVVSSTAWLKTAGNLPTVIWAEEGISTGQYQQNWGKYAYSQMRCVRNLGMEDATSSSIQTSGENYPEDNLVEVSKPEGWVDPSYVYRFDLRNLNEKSRRYFSSREFPAGDEFSVMNRLYDGFETGEFKYVGVNYHQTGGLKTILENGGSLPETPVGYRVPNLREGTIMHLYCSGSWWYFEGNYPGTMVSNYYSFGEFGSITYDWNVYSWTVSGSNITMSKDDKNQYVRFVRDWTPTP